MTSTITERALYAEYGRTLVIRPLEAEDTQALFEKICSQLENTKIEQDAQGNISIMAPTGGESSCQNSDITAQLHAWAKRDGRGRAFDSNVLFRLPDKSQLSPDASWVRNEKLALLSQEQRREFLRVVPDFVIELKSPTDSFSRLQAKMEDWRGNGVELGWLIHPDLRLVLVYHSGNSNVQKIENAAAVHGDTPVAGFTLDMQAIRDGLAFPQLKPGDIT